MTYPAREGAWPAIPGASRTKSSGAAGGFGGRLPRPQSRSTFFGDQLRYAARPVPDVTCRQAEAIPGFLGRTSRTSPAGRPQPIIGIDRNREAASHWASGHAQISATAFHAMMAGEDVTTLDGHGGQAYDVYVRLPADARADPSIVGPLPARRHCGVHGQARPPFASSGCRYRQQRRRGEIAREGATCRRCTGDRQPLRAAGRSGARSPRPARSRRSSFCLAIAGSRSATAESARRMRKFGGHGARALPGGRCIYMILAAQFEQLLHPLIASCPPLPLLGRRRDRRPAPRAACTLNIFVDDRLHHADGPRHEERASCWSTSRTSGARQRRHAARARSRWARRVLRPIMMTTAAMIFGMLPVGARPSSEGGEVTRADGRERHRRAHHLDDPHPRGGPGDLLAARQPRRARPAPGAAA